MSRTLSRAARLAFDTLEDRAVPAAQALYAVTQDWGAGSRARCG